MLYSLSSRLQTHDFADVAATGILVQDLEHDFAVARSAGCILCVLGRHAEDEEETIFPDVAKLDAPLVRSLIDQHHELTRHELEIAKAGHEILAMASPEQRLEAGARLNRAANDLFALYIAHMNREEEHVVPLMREHFTDPQMLQMQGRIIGSMPPERVSSILQYMLPSLNVTELTRLVGSLRAGAPPPVFQMVTDLATARVDPARWATVRQRVGF